MRVLIIEDEMGALDDLRSILAESAPDIRIAGTTESVMQSVAWLEKNPAPDLIFMDIHLSDGSAFEIFKRTAVEAPVIFTTATTSTPSMPSGSTPWTICSNRSPSTR